MSLEGRKEGAFPMAHILVVDDNEMVRRIVGHIMEAAGYRVSEACNGVRAIEALGRFPIDLVLTDLDMPEMNGEALLRKMRCRFPAIPCVAMSGESVGKGFDGFIQKPFDMQDLIKMVSEALERSRYDAWLVSVGCGAEN